MSTPIFHPDFPHLPLGRELRPEHDPRSRGFQTRFASVALRSVAHRFYGVPLDQWRIGSCTGNAAAGALNTKPLHRRGEPLFTEADAASFYADATALDEYDGTWYFDRWVQSTGEVVGHGDDTGSSGLAVAKALQQRGLLTRYEHAFGLDQALSTLVQLPLITGVPWYEGMFTPDARGYVNIGGSVAGGHEFLVRAIDVKARAVVAVNSWGPRWGIKGQFRMTWDTWGRLLSEDGDATVLYR